MDWIRRKVREHGKTVLIVTGAAVAAPVVVTAAVTAAGFTGTGIAASSLASSFMATYGGTVGAGSACAVLQSVGAAGLSTTATGAFAATGGAIAGVVRKFFRRGREENQHGEAGQQEDDNGNEDERMFHEAGEAREGVNEDEENEENGENEEVEEVEEHDSVQLEENEASQEEPEEDESKILVSISQEVEVEVEQEKEEEEEGDGKNAESRETMEENRNQLQRKECLDEHINGDMIKNENGRVLDNKSEIEYEFEYKGEDQNENKEVFKEKNFATMTI